MNYRKPVAFAISGALVLAVYSCEALVNPHVEHRQHEETPSTTYEFPNSTATATIGYSTFAGDFYLRAIDPKFRIKL
jgi:hypothetical protein